MAMRCVAVLLLAACVSIHADTYMHNPRGSNNRLNERSANRRNGNRMFDSQNNNRGGYNVGDSTEQASNREAQQYRMKYFESGPYKTMLDSDGQLTGQGQSLLTIEWTNQHGCGGDEDTDPHKLNCNLVLQYLCQEDTVTGDDAIRNGQSTQTQDHQRTNNLNENQGAANNRKNGAVQNDRGLHETWEWYDKCYNRERNEGLFTADQKLKTNNGNGYSSSIYTRQNPNGNRRGYECPEERDYYPYWHPSPWKDMAILVGNMSLCEFYQSESFNVRPKHECVETYGAGNTGNAKHWSRWNTEAECKENNGEWLAFTNYLEKAPQFANRDSCEANSGTDGVRYVWGRPQGETAEQCLVALDAPDCQPAPWTRVNHLGNTRGGQASRYQWTVPYFPSDNTQRCVLRLRYNITTDDYDPINTDASQNQNINAGVLSPIEQNPYVDIGADRLALRLAINTAQYGRTFQDRSHAFHIMPRPAGPGMASAKIHNLNVRGKRGNIVQVYPAVEYDFVPNDMEIDQGDLVHIQWTGSNTHNNNAPGGDGQTGDAGEGRGGTDRSNIVQMLDRLENYPLPFEQSTMWTGAKVKWIYNGNTDIAPIDLAVNIASSGYYQCMKAETCQGQSVQNKNKMNNQLNNAPASYGGALIEFAQGEYFYMGSRNNNFSNRSQKGRLLIK